MSIDNGQTWSLFPSMTYGALAQGGDLPHVNVTDLSLAQGNINVATGMPDLAGPDNPDDPTAAADPDLLYAGTYGEGAFAINLAPMILTGTTQIDPTDTGGAAPGGVETVTTATPTIDGLSEITGFGDATWITIKDETPGDSTFGQVIGGFDPSKVKLGQAIPASSGNSTDVFGNFAIPITAAFGANGLKTIEVYATDNAGSQSVPVTISFLLQATNLSHPAPTSAPPAPFLELTPTTPPYATVNNVPVTNNTSPQFDGTAAAGTSITVIETWLNAPAGPQHDTFTLPSTDVNSDGTFSFSFQDFTDSSGDAINNGTFQVTVTATYVQYSQLGASPASNSVSFQIDNTTPNPVSDLRLNPADDTGISGDDVTTDRQPQFIGTAPAGDTVELFVKGQSAIQNSVVAGSSQLDANGQSYDFAIQMPYSLTEGQTTLYVEVIDAAGNISNPSNFVGVAIASTEADYNGGPASDPALVVRNTATGQLQWIVQTPPGAAGPWFPQGVTNVPYSPAYVFNGTLSSGSAVVTAIGSTSGLVVGQDVTGTGIPAGATIKAINGGTSITLSVAATAGGIESLRAPPRTTSSPSKATSTATDSPTWRTTTPPPRPGPSSSRPTSRSTAPRRSRWPARSPRRAGPSAPPSPSSATSPPTVRPRWASSRSTPRARASGSSPAPAPARRPSSTARRATSPSPATTTPSVTTSRPSTGPAPGNS